MMLLLKHYWRGDLVDKLGLWQGTLRRTLHEGGLSAIARVARYTVLVNARPDTLPRLRRLTAKVLGEAAEEAVMTAGEMLIEQGRREGARRSTAELLTNMLTLRFGPLSEQVQARIAQADTETLGAWAERLFTAERAEEVVA